MFGSFTLLFVLPQTHICWVFLTENSSCLY